MGKSHRVMRNGEFTLKKPKPKTANSDNKNIYQRGPLSWQVKMRINGDSYNETFDSLADARTFRNGKRVGAALDPDFRRIMEARIRKTDAAAATLEKLLERYEKEVTATKKSATSEGYRIVKVKRYGIAKMSIYTLNADDVARFLDELEADGMRGPSRRKYCALLSHVFNTARRRWRLRVNNPIPSIETPAAGKPRVRRLEDDEESRLLAALDAENALAGAFTRLAIETGMRRGELLGLTWADVNLKTHVAKLHDTKNGESRRVPLSSAAEAVLEKLPAERTGRALPIAPRELRRAWESARAAIGAPDLRFHDLRHEATSRFFEKGLDSMEVASITGHKTMQMLKGYTHLRSEDLAKKLG